MEKMKLEVPLPEKISFNAMYSGMHWSKRKQLADEFHLAVWAAARSAKTPRLTVFPVKMTYTYYLRGRTPDISNLGLITKLCEDGLVKAGVLPDDDFKHVVEITTTARKADFNRVIISGIK